MPADTSPPIQTCAVCGAEVDVAALEPLVEVECPICSSPMVVAKTIGPYELMEVMGRGGMGVVYRATDHQLARQVALKVLRIDYSDDAEFIQKLEVEAAITGGITHPHVVKVYTTGYANGRFFIAMELVDKGTLDDLMEIQGRIAEAQALEIASQIAQGLRAAHAMGLIHRDVKPGNILFADSHSAKIVDFGLAILEEAARSTGEIWGTPYYVSPERLDRKHEDFRSDMYSLGATIFHAIAGRPPFEAEDAGLVALKHLKSQAVSLQSFAPWVAGSTAFVINRMLQKDPNARYGSYDELIGQLEYARTQLANKTSQSPQKTRVVLETDADRKLWGQLTIAVLVLIVVLGLGAGAYFLFWSSPGTPSNRQQTQFDEARTLLLANQPAEAAAKFEAIGTAPDMPKSLRQWSLLNAAVAYLLKEDISAARGALETLKGIPADTKDPSRRLEGDFFQSIPKLLNDDRVLRHADYESANLKSYGAFIPLIAGLKDWQLKNFGEAAFALREYASAKPEGEFAWIAGFQPLVKDFIADDEIFEEALAKIGKQNQADALRTVNEAKEKLHLKNPAMLAKLDAAAKAANYDPNKAPKAAEEKPAPPSVDEEKNLLKQAQDKAVSEARDWKFNEAKNALQPVGMTNPDLRRELRSQIRKLEWLRRFKETLTNDLANGYSGPALAPGGAPPGKAIVKATDAGIDFGSAEASSITPWSKVNSDLLLSLATTFLEKGTSPQEKAERSWLAGAFAIMAGKGQAAGKLLLDAVNLAGPSGWEGDQLPLLMPPPKRYDLARKKSAAASSSAAAEQPDKAVDESATTSWSSAAGGQQWLRVDLGKEYAINRWVLQHANSQKVDQNANTADFVLQRSNDDKTWTNVDPVVNNTLDVTDRWVAPFNARYVRVLITKPSQKPDQFPSARIYGFEVYGSEAGNVIGNYSDSPQAAWLPRLIATDIGLAADDSSGSTSVDEQTGSFTIRSSGSGLGAKSDSFRFLHKPQAGNTKIEVRVDKVEKGNDDSQAGVMFRDGLAPAARSCFLGVMPDGALLWRVRGEEGGETVEVRDQSPGWPCFLRLGREGNSFTAEVSRDLKDWKAIGQKGTISMGATAEVGIAASSHKSKTFSASKLEVLHLSK